MRESGRDIPQLLMLAIAKAIAIRLLFTGDSEVQRYTNEEEARLHSALQGLVKDKALIEVLDRDSQMGFHYGNILRTHAHFFQ